MQEKMATAFICRIKSLWHDMLKKHQHLSHCQVRTDVQEYSWQQKFCRLKALSHSCVPSFPLSFASTPSMGLLLFSLHQVWFSATGIVSIMESNNDTMINFFVNKAAMLSI